MASAATKRPDGQTERRRANRAALSLTATMREGSRSKVQVRVIDISTGGCRVECTSAVPVDACVWLSIPGLENQYCRVVWHCQEFVGIEFEKPLSAAVFDKLIKEQAQLQEKTIAELRDNSDIKEFYLGLNEGGTRKSYHDTKHYKRRKRWLH